MAFQALNLIMHRAGHVHSRFEAHPLVNPEWRQRNVGHEFGTFCEPTWHADMQNGSASLTTSSPNNGSTLHRTHLASELSTRSPDSEPHRVQTWTIVQAQQLFASLDPVTSRSQSSNSAMSEEAKGATPSDNLGSSQEDDVLAEDEDLDRLPRATKDDAGKSATDFGNHLKEESVSAATPKETNAATEDSAPGSALDNVQSANSSDNVVSEKGLLKYKLCLLNCIYPIHPCNSCRRNRP